MKTKDITKEEINKITEHSPIREKAFFTIMRQGGLTPHTIQQLKIKDLEPDTPTPCKINIPQATQKGKFKPPTFIGKEAIKYTKQYLATRINLTPESLLFTIKNADTKINTKDVSRTFRIKAQKYEKTKTINPEEITKGKPNKLQLYSLVRFYRKNAKKYLIEAKNNPNQNEEFYRKLYKEKAMPNLEIKTPTTTELENRIEKIENMIPIFIKENDIQGKFLTKEELNSEIKEIREHEQWLKKHPKEAEKEYNRMKNEEIQNLTSDLKNLKTNYEILKKTIDNIKNTIQKNQRN
jgi:hypothetical protein